MSQTIRLAYGRTGLDVTLPDEAILLSPQDVTPLADPPAAVRAALAAPIGSRPLAELVAAGQRVAIVTSDLTRPTPNRLLLEALLEVVEARGVPDADVVILNGTGLHRGNTAEEFVRMYGPEIPARYRIVNHDGRDPATLRRVGTDPRGAAIEFNAAYLDADVRIVTGFIEPHLFAGYSGGGKGVMPGIAGRATIMSNHSTSMIGHPNATFGVTAGNPIFEEMRAHALLTAPTFLLNVTLDSEKRVTGVFAGGLAAAHDAGIAACRAQALVEVDAPFDIVVTTNGGYPADLNLYQSIKGLVVAARALRPGGQVILAAECEEGIGQDYGRILAEHGSPLELLDALTAPGATPIEDGWQAQLQAMAQAKGTVWLYSTLDAATTAATHLRHCTDIGATVLALRAEIEAREGRPARMGVLPFGQQAVPVVREAVSA